MKTELVYMQTMDNQKELLELIEKSLRERDGNNQYFDFAVLKEPEIIILRNLTGIDFTGYRHCIDRSGIIHAMKHANITISDLLLIPLIVKNYDAIDVGKNEDTIIYKKLIVSEYFYVEEIRKGRKKLAIKTLYKRAKSKKAPD